MEVIRKDDPVTLAKYAEDQNLTDKAIWKWAKGYVKNKKVYNRMKRNLMRAKTKQRVKYQFGVKVPGSIAEAYRLDAINKNTNWTDAIEKEVKLLRDLFGCFKLADTGEITNNYQKIPLLWTFAVKFDGRHRARLVAGGHKTQDLTTNYYSGVIELETIRILFAIAIIACLKCVAGDVASAYIQAFTNEKVYTIAGQEFGPWKGKVIIIVKALYGMKSSGAMWHQNFSDNMRDLGFRPCKADFDLWIRTTNGHHEYVAVMVDDLLIFSKEPEMIIETLTGLWGYELKGVGVPSYYSGADIEFDKGCSCWTMGAKTYIKNVTDKIEKLLELPLKNFGSPLDAGDHPEMDDTDLLEPERVAIYQMLIGSAQWAVTLGRYNIQYATNTLARHAQQPREGHMQRALRVFGYLKHNARAKLYFDPSPMNLDGIEFREEDWTEQYPFAEEYVNEDAPEATGEALQVTAFVDASHATCLTTRRSVRGILVMVGHAPVYYYSKHQNTVETSTYGSELVALRIAVEAILGIRYKLRAMGLKIQDTTTILCDNKLVVLNMQLPSSSLKKKHNWVAFHKAREAVAAGIVRLGHVDSKENASDILTKSLGPSD